jgi:WGR domain-containing protein
MVEMSYGRIGTMGRTKVRSFGTTEQAQEQVDVCLRKRSTAPQRIGVAYRVREAWRQPALDNWLGGVSTVAITPQPMIYHNV